MIGLFLAARLMRNIDRFRAALRKREDGSQSFVTLACLLVPAEAVSIPTPHSRGDKSVM